MQPRSRFFWVAPVLILSAYVLLLAHYVHKMPKRDYGDFRVYYKTAERFLAGEDVYDSPDASITPFKYTPAFACLISPLALVSKDTASRIFFTLNFLGLLASLYFSEKLSGAALTGFRRLLLYTLPVVFCFRPLLGALNSGQVVPLFMGVLLGGLYLLSRGRTWIGAPFVALSAMLKYLSLIFLPYFLFRKKFQAFLATAAFLALYSVLPAIFMGTEPYARTMQRWAPAVGSTTLDRGSFTDHKNQSFYSLFVRHFMKDSPYRDSAFSFNTLPFEQALLIAAALAALAYLAFLVLRASSGAWTAPELAMLFIAMALFNPNAWPFNGIFLLFPCVVLFARLLSGPVSWKIALPLALSFVLTNVGSENLVGDDWQRQFEVWSFSAWGWIALLPALWMLPLPERAR